MHKSRLMHIIMHQEWIKLKSERALLEGVEEEEEKEEEEWAHRGKTGNFSFHSITTSAFIVWQHNHKEISSAFCVSCSIQKMILAFHSSSSCAAFNKVGRLGCFVDCVFYVHISLLLYKCVFFSFLLTHSHTLSTATLFRNGVIFIHIA